VSTHGESTTYTVHAKRWKRGWELHIDGFGVTQSKTLNDAEAMVRDYIALDTGAAPDSFAVEIVPEVGDGLDEKTRAARQAIGAADRAQRAAAAQSREAARGLKRAGLSGREIAVVLRVSPQRVSQLLGGNAILVRGESKSHSAGKKTIRRQAHGKRRSLLLPAPRRVVLFLPAGQGVCPLRASSMGVLAPSSAAWVSAEWRSWCSVAPPDAPLNRSSAWR
jgi:hypothetical protein